MPISESYQLSLKVHKTRRHGREKTKYWKRITSTSGRMLTLAKGYFGCFLKTKFVVLLSGIATVILSTNLIRISTSYPGSATTAAASQSVLWNTAQVKNSLYHHPDSQNYTNKSFRANNNTVQQQGLHAPVDLTYVNVMDGKHPHMGATSPHDINQVGFYVPNVAHLRSNPPPLSWTSKELELACNRRDGAYEALQRIKISDPSLNARRRPAKILCVIYSIEKNRDRYQAIRETWGPRCDGFFVASDQTDPSFDAVNIVHAGPEAYSNMYQKVRSIWAYIYDNFYYDFDWFHLGGDDMFVMVENLRSYVEGDEIQMAANGGSASSTTENMQVPLFLGGSISYMGDIKRVYQTGGPGYTLNRAALKKLVVDGLPRFGDEKRVSWEDIIVSRLFREMNISAYRTTDDDNGVRYNHYGPASHYFGQEPAFYPNWTKPLKYNRGKNYSSVHSISFHYVPPNNMRRFYALLYGLCA